MTPQPGPTDRGRCRPIGHQHKGCSPGSTGKSRQDPPMTLLQVHQWVGRDPMYGIDIEIDGLWHQSRDILAAAVQSARELFDRLPLTATVSDRRAAALVDEPRHVSMIAVGSRGCGGFAGPAGSTGSPSLTLVAQAHCPVDPPSFDQIPRAVSDGRGGTTWIMTSGCQLPD